MCDRQLWVELRRLEGRNEDNPLPRFARFGEPRLPKGLRESVALFAFPIACRRRSHPFISFAALIFPGADKQDLAFQPAVGVFIRGPRVLSFSDFRITNYPKGKYVAGDKGEAVPETTFDGITTY